MKKNLTQQFSTRNVGKIWKESSLYYDISKKKKNFKYMVTMLLFPEFPTEELTVFQLFTPKNNNTMHWKLYKSQFLLSKKYDRTQYSSLVLLVQ